jgi:hypothetical protein
MEQLENDDSLAPADKEIKIRAVFDGARKDIAVFQAKKDCKKEEMAVLDAEAASTTGPVPTTSNTSSDIPPSSGTVVTTSHPEDQATL